MLKYESPVWEFFNTKNTITVVCCFGNRCKKELTYQSIGNQSTENLLKHLTCVHKFYISGTGDEKDDDEVKEDSENMVGGMDIKDIAKARGSLVEVARKAGRQR